MKNKFIDKVTKGASIGWEKYGILPSISIAQAILESGWGKSKLAKESNNLFGIKASNDWKGAKKNYPTKEQDAKGKVSWINAYFRAYDSWDDSIEDHGAFFKSTPWRVSNYKAVFDAKDYKQQAKALQSSGYATDVKYADKLISLIESENLTKYDGVAPVKGDDKMVTVALDIGHGSNTFPGGKGIYKNGKGYAEHDFNSKLVIAIDKLLKQSGVNTLIYQKPYKPDVNLTKRTNYYNSKGVDLVYSIHANYNANTAVNGRCVFYWHTSKASKRMADITVAEIKAAGYSTHGNGLHASKRGSWTNLHICRATNAPAVLVENGFMSGSKDFDLVFGSKQSEYVKDMAVVHAKSICKFFGISYKGDGTSVTVKPSKPTSKPSKPTSSKPKPTPKPSKSKTSRRNGIKAIQRKLNRYKVNNIKVDGYDGPDTQRAVIKAYQYELNRQFSAGLSVDGIPGPATDRAAVVLRSNKSYGNLAHLVQAMIYLKGVDFKVDGYWQGESVKATKVYQRKVGFKGDSVDGLPGKATMAKLIR